MKVWILAVAFFIVVAWVVPIIANILGYIGLAFLCLLGAHCVDIWLEEA